MSIAQNLRLVAVNLVDAATLSASPALVSTLPVTNLQDSRRAKMARTTSTAQQVITGDLAATGVCSAAALWRHNLSPAGTWRIELFTAAAQGGTKIYDSGAVLAYTAKCLGDLFWGSDPLGASVFTGWAFRYSVLWFPPVSALSFRLTLTDAANPDGYMQAARLVLGYYLMPAVNVEFGPEISWVDNSKQVRMDGGSLHTEAVEPYRELNVELAWLADVERAQWLEIARVTGKRGDVLVSLYPEAGGLLERDHCFTGRFASAGAVNRRFPQYFRQKLSIVES
jgi:hypothetical protein